MTALVTAFDPGAFLDGETWAFTLTINQPDGAGPLDLTGSRLYVAFAPLLSPTKIASCDTAAGDGSLVITDAPAGKATFTIKASARNGWSATRADLGRLIPTAIVGDLYRDAGNGWDGVVRIKFPVLPSLGTPSA